MLKIWFLVFDFHAIIVSIGKSNTSNHLLITEEEKELIRLKKENQQLRMENDILKQAALILGEKSK